MAQNSEGDGGRVRARADQGAPFAMFPRLAHDETGRRGIPSWAIIGIFLILLFWFIAQARAFLMPVTLAVLLFFVFVPLKRVLGRWGLGEGVIAAFLVSSVVALVAVLGVMASGPISEAVDRAPQIGERLEERFGQIRRNFQGLEDAARKIDEISAGTPEGADITASVTTPDAQGIRVELRDATSSTSVLAEQVAMIGPAVISQGVFTLILLYFMLAAGDLLYLKIVQSFDSMREKRAAYTALREIESALGRYMLSITIINAALGVAIGLVMWAWGMPSPLLFGLAAFVLNYIPYIGSMIGTALALIVALVAFPDLWTPLLVAASYVALTSIEGQLVTPYFVSRRLQLNTVVVFLTVALWAWLWSVLGMVVAVPVLVVIRVLADHVPGMQKFGNFLAGEAPALNIDEAEDGGAEDEAGVQAGSRVPPAGA